MSYLKRLALYREALAWEALAKKWTPRSRYFVGVASKMWTRDMHHRFIEHMELVDDSDPATTDPVLDMLWLAEECRDEAVREEDDYL